MGAGVELNLKSLIGKLDDTCRQALEGSAGLALSRTNYNIEIEHWLNRLIEGTPTWMKVPPAQQTRLGMGLGQFARLGDPEDELGEISAAAMIGDMVLDGQQHFTVEIGPLDHARLHAFCSRPEERRRVAQLCALAAGI